MLKDTLKIILIDSLPIIAIFLIFRKILKLTKIPIFLLIIFSMLLISLYELHNVQIQINKSYYNCDYLFK